MPNISYGPIIVDAAKRSCDAFIDVHLMIYNPDQYTEAFVKAGADLIAVHYEAVPHLHRSIQNIKNHGVKAGVAINPATAISCIEPILADVDMVVLMSVNPGFGGQKFIESTFQRVEQLNWYREDQGLDFLIEIDGGVGLGNAERLASLGADVLVAGSSVFKAPNIPARVKELKQLADTGRKSLA